MTAGLAAPRVDRASAEDMVPLASAHTSTPMQVGAIVGIGGRPEPDLLLDALRVRIQGIPRLRQRLIGTPFGCGRPIWVDDPSFRFEHHVGVVELPGALHSGHHPRLDDPDPSIGADPGSGLLDLAATTVTTPLPTSAPLWRAAVAVGSDGEVALVVAFHHVLADGMGGLTVLARLVDGMTAPPPDVWPAPRPSTAAVATDAWRTRWRSLRSAPQALRRSLAAARLLGPAARVRAAPCSINRPTGSDRRLAVVRAPLDPLRLAAHRHGVTVNDAVLVTIAAALRRVLLGRGEDVDRFVISVPVAARDRASSSSLGNRVGVVPIEVPATGPLEERLSRVGDRTSAARSGERGASAALVGPAFRVLGRLRLLGPLMDHQRMVHTFSTNLRGPDEELAIAGHPVTDLIGVALAVGNVTVSFTVVSYAGVLTITLVADGATWPTLAGLQDALYDELAVLS